MITARTPGFTADASLYNASNNYRMAGGPSDMVRSPRVLPQLQSLGWGTSRDVCTACGCIASFFNCDCGNSQRKLDCIRNGGPSRVAWAGDTMKPYYDR